MTFENPVICTVDSTDEYFGGGMSEILKQSSKAYHDFVLWAWL